MLRLAAVVTLALPGLALAQPVLVKVENQVPAGKRPTLRVTAVVRLRELRLELERREDGAKLQVVKGPLKGGQELAIPIGDGSSGIAHWAGSLQALPEVGDPWRYDLTFETLVLGELRITYRRDHLDLEGRRLEFQASGPVKRAELQVIGDDGRELGRGAADYDGTEAPGSWLGVPWRQGPGTVMTLKLRVLDRGGLAQNVTLTPWSVTIPHEEVNFATDSAAIEAGEERKLEEARGRILAAFDRAKAFVKCRLFIAGHTDTVGSRDHNRKLSVDRARAIADWFRRRGLPLPVSYEGFGEERLKVKTADETDEARNRRADYVLAAEEPDPGSGVFRWREAR